VRAAWEGLDPAKVWDCHCHLAGIGDAGAGATGTGVGGIGVTGADTAGSGVGRQDAGASGRGIYLDPSMSNRFNPLRSAQRLFFMNAGCVRDVPGQVDKSYVERMATLQGGMRPGAKLLLLALDASVNEQGEESWDKTSLYIPNRYAAEVARRHPQSFEWAASVHPYRRDCVARLEVAVSEGARALKWVPASMGIDPASKRCDPLYQALARLGTPLITHAGLERALAGHDAQELGNPLRLRRALDQGVRVVVAHCASMGEDLDIDRGTGGGAIGSFELFSRMMDEPRYVGRLYGDLSAMTQAHRAGHALRRVIEREEWHPRLLNGSDYPLPGVFPLYSVDYLAELGYIEKSAAPLFKGLREYNALLFDFVLKRSLRAGGRRLAPGIFETREFFARA
jgi:mannonate dehydratase